MTGEMPTRPDAGRPARRPTMRRGLTALGWAVGLIAILALTPDASADANATSFSMVHSAGVATCLPTAGGQVTISSLGPVELMRVTVSGLPANTDFDFFVIQLPTAPFGLSWYQGDIETDAQGHGEGTFLGRFSIETFIVAPGSGPAPVVHPGGPFPDASINPAANPVHMFHLGLWFDSSADAVAAGCAATVTPFNGDHTAGIQVLNTSNFANDQGPLRQVVPGPTASGLVISPASGRYATNQNFDLDILVFAAGKTVLGGQVTVDGVDVTTALARCIVPGTLVSGGFTLKCPGLRGGIFSPGTHTLSVSLDLSGGSTVSDTVIWNIDPATGP